MDKIEVLFTISQYCAKLVYLFANEDLRTIDAEDYSALVVTSKRYLYINSKNGVWAETPRSKLLR